MTAKDLLTASGISTYQELADRTGLSRQRAYQIWYGQTGIGRKHAKIISQILGINLALLRSVEPKENGR